MNVSMRLLAFHISGFLQNLQTNAHRIGFLFPEAPVKEVMPDPPSFMCQHLK